MHVINACYNSFCFRHRRKASLPKPDYSSEEENQSVFEHVDVKMNLKDTNDLNTNQVLSLNTLCNDLDQPKSSSIENKLMHEHVKKYDCNMNINSYISDSDLLSKDSSPRTSISSYTANFVSQRRYTSERVFAQTVRQINTCADVVICDNSDDSEVD